MTHDRWWCDGAHHHHHYPYESRNTLSLFFRRCAPILQTQPSAIAAPDAPSVWPTLPIKRPTFGSFPRVEGSAPQNWHVGPFREDSPKHSPSIQIHPNTYIIPLKNMKVSWEGLSHILWNIKKKFQTTSQFSTYQRYCVWIIWKLLWVMKLKECIFLGGFWHLPSGAETAWHWWVRVDSQKVQDHNSLLSLRWHKSNRLSHPKISFFEQRNDDESFFGRVAALKNTEKHSKTLNCSGK